MDSINWDIVRNYLTHKVYEFLIKNRNNTDDKQISQLCRNLDPDGKQTSQYIDALVDEIYLNIYKYVKLQEITSSYTLNRRLQGRADITQPPPQWCKYPRLSNNSNYEIATTHDGIICSQYISSFLNKVENKRLNGQLENYMNKTPYHMLYN